MVRFVLCVVVCVVCVVRGLFLLCGECVLLAVCCGSPALFVVP